MDYADKVLDECLVFRLERMKSFEELFEQPVTVHDAIMNAWVYNSLFFLLALFEI